MKKLSLLILLFIISCGNKTESTDRFSENSNDTLNNLENKIIEPKITFISYAKEGILLNGNVEFYDDNFNVIEKLKINEISKVQIIAKSNEIYNIKNSKDYCLKSNFIKINFKNKDYIIFGKDIYELNDIEKIDFQNENNEYFTIFPITNFEMGASDEDGLTGCDDFSYLIIFNKKNNKYLTINFPKNQENQSNKFASLLHDEGSEEKIYKIKTIKDSLVLSIKVSYQEGFGSYNLISSFKDNFKESLITNRDRFDDEIKYNELK